MDLNEINVYKPDIVARELFGILDKKIMELSPDVKRKINKLYVAYKCPKNFVCVQLQERKLGVYVCLDYSDVKDDKHLCHLVRRLDSNKNGTLIRFEKDSDINYIMKIITKSFNAHATIIKLKG